MKSSVLAALATDMPIESRSSEVVPSYLSPSALSGFLKSRVSLSSLENSLWLAAKYRPDLLQFSKSSQTKLIPNSEDPVLFAQKMFSDGYSIAVNFVEEVDPQIAEYTRAVGEYFGGTAYASLFLSPRDAACFLPHSDGIDVLAVQLEGVKSWSIAPGTTKYARHKHSYVHDESVEFKPSEIFELLDESALYVPRGYVHSVRSSKDNISFHISFGIHAPRRYEVLREAALMGADSFSNLRADMSFSASSDERDLLHDVEALRTAFGGLYSRPDQIRHAVSLLRARAYSSLTVLPSARLAAVAESDRIDSGDSDLGEVWYQRWPGMPVECAILRGTNEGCAGISFPGLSKGGASESEPYIVAPVAAYPVFRSIARMDDRPFLAKELQGHIDHESKIRICEKLVANGLLRRL